MGDIIIFLYILAFAVGVIISLFYSAIFLLVANVKTDFLTRLSLSIGISISFLISSLITIDAPYYAFDKYFLVAVFTFFVLTYGAVAYVLKNETGSLKPYKTALCFSLILSIGTGIISYFVM